MHGEIWILIPLAAIAASAWKAKHGYGRYRSRKDRYEDAPHADPENGRLRDEIKTLKDRIAVLERIATDDAPAKALDREIEKLR